ncbi:Uncharacterised protein [Candidatus Tiddalikarchaeum anstoanum]|nr:Uncharacterised protein [Candidatus Tiddalikarchaeum anstoanum]
MNSDPLGLMISSSLEQTFGEGNFNVLNCEKNKYICELPKGCSAIITYIENETPVFDEEKECWCADIKLGILVRDELTFAKNKILYKTELMLSRKKDPISYLINTLGKRIKENVPYLN